MNILILSNTLGLGGTERVVQNFSVSLHKKGMGFVGVGSFDPSGPRSFVLTDNHIPIFDLNSENINQVIESNSVDVVFVHMLDVDKLNIKNKKVIIANEVIFCGAHSETANLNFIISHALATKIIEQKQDAKLQVIYYPFDTEHWSSIQQGLSKKDIKESLGLSENSFVVTRTARSELNKWSILFINSTRELLKRDKDIYLVTTGMPFFYILFLWRYRARVINFAPTGDDRILAKIYTVGDLYFHSAEAGETFGMVLAEAMFFGLPIITHSTHFSKEGVVDYFIDNSQIELIENKVNGLVTNDIEEIIEYCKTLKINKNLLGDFANSNREKVLKNYDLNLITERFISTINQYKANSYLSDNPRDITDTYYNLLGKVDRKNWYKESESSYIKFLKLMYLFIRKIFRSFGFNIEKLGFTNKQI